jgi:DNA integrity scanning protein DisA with diadenylate cyclase activity
VAHRLGFKFGHNGFYYVLREPGNNSHVLQEILISTSFKEALEFLEFDYSTYLKGFQTLEDIFQFVIANPHFNKEIYLLENRNAVSRVRDSKRKTYNLFLKYIEHLDAPPSTFDKHVLREKYLQLALDKFPMFKVKYAQTLEKLKIKQEVKEKFNGTLVQTITGLTGKELGNFIMTFKSSFGNENDFTSFVLNSSPDVISSTIKSFSY